MWWSTVTWDVGISRSKCAGVKRVRHGVRVLPSVGELHGAAAAGGVSAAVYCRRRCCQGRSGGVAVPNVSHGTCRQGVDAAFAALFSRWGRRTSDAREDPTVTFHQFPSPVLEAICSVRQTGVAALAGTLRTLTGSELRATQLALASVAWHQDLAALGREIGGTDPGLLAEVAEAILDACSDTSAWSPADVRALLQVIVDNYAGRAEVIAPMVIRAIESLDVVDRAELTLQIVAARTANDHWSSATRRRLQALVSATVNDQWSSEARRLLGPCSPMQPRYRRCATSSSGTGSTRPPPRSSAKPTTNDARRSPRRRCERARPKLSCGVEAGRSPHSEAGAGATSGPLACRSRRSDARSRSASRYRPSTPLDRGAPGAGVSSPN